MLGRSSLLLFLLALGGCGISGWFSSKPEINVCPQVQIIRDNSYLTQFVKYKETFQISVSGYEGYCYYDRTLQRNRAVIEPVFKIKRLRPSDETDVRFSYYTETVKGPPEYLGKKTYFVTAHIGLDDKETIYKASAVNVFIPPEMLYGYDINLGLWISPEEALYNRRTFDINYRYVDE